MSFYYLEIGVVCQSELDFTSAVSTQQKRVLLPLQQEAKILLLLLLLLQVFFLILSEALFAEIYVSNIIIHSEKHILMQLISYLANIVIAKVLL